MKKRQGQAMVEFALIAPMLCLMIFGLIYAGFMFMEYLHFSNQVRTVARQIAVTEKSKRTETLLTSYENSLKNLYNEYNMPKMYQPTVGIAYDYTDEAKKIGDVVVTVSFDIEQDTYNSLPNLLKNPDDVSYGVGFPPKSIKAIQYRMKLEGQETSASSSTTEDDSSSSTTTEGTSLTDSTNGIVSGG